jgi:Tfp pilus assembly ATPase PilU
MVTEEDLVRARTDGVFRQKLMAESLDRLLALLNQMRRAPDVNAVRTLQIREGVDLAVKLADHLQQNDGNSGPRAA